MTDLERIQYDIETLMNSYSKDNELYTELEVSWIRLGLSKALKIVNKYIKDKENK